MAGLMVKLLEIFYDVFQLLVDDKENSIFQIHYPLCGHIGIYRVYCKSLTQLHARD